MVEGRPRWGRAESGKNRRVNGEQKGPKCVSHLGKETVANALLVCYILQPE